MKVVVERYWDREVGYGDEYVKIYVDGERVLGGDYYHDHINDRIEGFKLCLDHLKIEHEFVSKNIVGEKEYNDAIGT